MSVGQRLQRLVARRDVLQAQLREKQAEYESLVSRHQINDQAVQVLRDVGRGIQEAFELKLTELATYALREIFDYDYEFKIEFIERRGQIEADAYLLKGDHRVDLDDSVGGGLLDVLSLALKLSCWAIKGKGQCRPILALDEPFKHLDTARQPRAVQLIHRLCEDMGLQVILVSHNPLIIDHADKAYEVVIDDHWKSRVRERT